MLVEYDQRFASVSDFSKASKTAYWQTYTMKRSRNNLSEMPRMTRFGMGL